MQRRRSLPPASARPYQNPRKASTSRASKSTTTTPFRVPSHVHANGLLASSIPHKYQTPTEHATRSFLAPAKEGSKRAAQSTRQPGRPKKARPALSWKKARPFLLRAHSDEIGEISRSEEEYDFAILLKPAASEELIEGSGISLKKNNISLREKLHAAGLQTKRLRSIDEKQTIIKVKAPQHILELGAEQLKMKKRRQIDHTWTIFSRQCKHLFAHYDQATCQVHFSDRERQTIVYHLITSDEGAGLSEYSDFAKIICQKFPLHKSNLNALRNNWVTFWRKPVAFDTQNEELNEFGKAIIEQSGLSSSHSTQSSWCCLRFLTGLFEQPIDEIAEYYGEKIAFYFAWLRMYTLWLILPSIAGLVLFYHQLRDRTLDQPLAPYYAIFMACWASFFLISWERHANILAYRWGVLGYEQEETERPEFQGDPNISTPTAKRYPHWKRWLKMLLNMWIVVVCIILMVYLMYIALDAKDKREHTEIKQLNITDITLDNVGEVIGSLDAWFYFYLLITPMLYGFIIPISDFVFTWLATAMNQWENHKTDTAYATHLILKVFSFRFVHVFASLYYYAFANGQNLFKIAIQLASFMIAGQTWNNVVETGLPFLKRKYYKWQQRRSTQAAMDSSLLFQLPLQHKSRVSLEEHAELNKVNHNQCVRLEQATAKAWEEAQLAPYDTFEDYTEMMIQFGYVCFFSVAFPLSPLLALLNNIFEMRSDAYKLCRTKQRPLARRASGIGIWYSVLKILSAVAVITNCLHIALTTNQLETQLNYRFNWSLTAEHKVWLLFILEHLLLIFKLWVDFVIPKIPYSVQRKLRLERQYEKQEIANALAAKLAQEQSQNKGSLATIADPQETDDIQDSHEEESNV